MRIRPRTYSAPCRFSRSLKAAQAAGLTTVTIRGGKPNFTLVMIDGIPVNDITHLLGVSFDLSALPIGNIERIEIVRGPLSSVYGSQPQPSTK
jgi:vitamin B12 transporter